MQDNFPAKSAILREIEEAEFRLHRLYEARDRAPADEQAVVEAKIQETKGTLEQLRTHLHGPGRPIVS